MRGAQSRSLALCRSHRAPPRAGLRLRALRPLLPLQTSGKLEKAEILEMTVQYLRALHSADFPRGREKGAHGLGQEKPAGSVRHTELGVAVGGSRAGEVSSPDPAGPVGPAKAGGRAGGFWAGWFRCLLSGGAGRVSRLRESRPLACSFPFSRLGSGEADLQWELRPESVVGGACTRLGLSFFPVYDFPALQQNC